MGPNPCFRSVAVLLSDPRAGKHTLHDIGGAILRTEQVTIDRQRDRGGAMPASLKDLAKRSKKLVKRYDYVDTKADAF